MFSRDELPNWAEGVTALGAVITLVALAFAAIQIRHVSRQMHRDFEMQYLLRFWALMDRRSRRFRLSNKTTRDDRILLKEYLSLCEDQIALRGLARVTDDTWSYWSRDIRGMCTSAPVGREIDRAGHAAYPHVRRLLADSEYDPLRYGKMRRRWQGL